MSTKQINDQIDLLFDNKLKSMGQVGGVNEMPQIKSQKAKEYSDTEVDKPNAVNAYVVEGRANEAATQAVILAETEAHDRAVETFKTYLSNYHQLHDSEPRYN